jgi:alcohol dehydrogenase (cytochrome c)
MQRWSFLLLLSMLPMAASARQSVWPNANAFENRCSICHGGDANGGGRAPSILGFIRYHTDAELSDLIHNGRQERGMPAFQIPPDELRGLVVQLRQLAGSTAAMGTAGLTGEGLKRKSGRKLGPGPRPAALKLSSGGVLDGTLMSEDEFSADLLTADGKYHLLSREGGAYREKPIEPKSDWTTYNGDLSGNRYSVLDRINAGNVKDLAVAWLFPTPSSPRIEATPLVVEGVMYLTGWNELYALDATTGRQLWMYRQPHTKGLLSNAGKGANRGAAIAGDKVFMVTDGAHLLAFNRKNGEKLWDIEMGAVKDGYSASAAPLLVGDLLIVGVAGGEEGARGFLDAYKISTGEHAWRFYTIPRRGEKGSETWMGSALEHGCGATWLTGSYDPELGLVYWSTGNPCPDYNGDERKGDNLHTNSVVALSVKTGELKWHYQFTPHDMHDWDAAEPLLLIDQPWQGKPRKLLLHADRNGFFFVLDRATGELLEAEPFVKVNWASGYGKDGRPLLTKNFETSSEGTLTCPASSGGTNWFSDSWNPVSKLFYVRSTDWCAIYNLQEDPLVENRWYGGVAPNQPGAENFIRALDIHTGKKVWEFPLSIYGRGGILSTAGGLVFFGGPQGAFAALDASSGKDLWHLEVGQDWQASPMTYMVGGKQYVVLPGPAGVFAFALRK